MRLNGSEVKRFIAVSSQGPRDSTHRSMIRRESVPYQNRWDGA